MSTGAIIFVLWLLSFQNVSKLIWISAKMNGSYRSVVKIFYGFLKTESEWFRHLQVRLISVARKLVRVKQFNKSIKQTFDIGFDRVLQSDSICHSPTTAECVTHLFPLPVVACALNCSGPPVTSRYIANRHAWFRQDIPTPLLTRQS